MALPTLDATFASAADLPRRQMLAKWLVEELDSGSIADYWTLPEKYLWAKIAVAAGGPKTEADYISLPKNYAWSDIYNAVAGLIPPSSVLVSGAGSSEANGTYTYRGESGGKPYYNLVGYEDNVASRAIYWDTDTWNIVDENNSGYYFRSSEIDYPYSISVEAWSIGVGQNPIPLVTESPTQTPNHTDWSENVALGHIAAAYRGDTGNPEALATYISWPWRYQVASIITSL